MTRRMLAALLLSTLFQTGLRADNAQELKFFEDKVRPLFAEHCYECHGPKKQEAGLRLDSYDGLSRGGDSGELFEPGEPDQSLLVVAISYRNEELQMPPEARLDATAIAAIRRWIEAGAPHPDASGKRIPQQRVDLEAGRKFWAFQPPVAPQLPAVQAAAWPQTPIDFFILAGLEKRQLTPATKADRRTLIRRATFDLTGLPPTVAEVDAFLKDDADDAFARVVDRLLASPAYGERWGRHWLDVARYADSNGLDENIAHGNAWRYRDWVVDAWNRDKPFDQFAVEQLAGDLMTASDPTIRNERLIATGFLSLGPKVLAEVDERKMEMDIVDEQIETFGRAFLGMTFGCARCHDHKFDPVRMEDYYGLAGVFKSTRSMEHFRKIARWHENEIPSPEDERRQQEHQRLVEQKREALKSAEDADKAKQELAELEKSAPVIPTAMGVTEGNVADVPVHIRGSHLTTGKVVSRGFPAVFTRELPPVSPGSSGRLEMARWLTDERHPLTARVVVNRVWRWHFGRGIVRSTDNFGELGERPDNPELLDWLAVRFVRSGWSLKKLHRLILLSGTWQMSSAFNRQAAAVDPDNRLHWRHSIRRLEAEEIRDSILAVAGSLDRRFGGSLLHVKNREFIFNHTSEDKTSYDSNRRSVYLPVVRNHLYDVFELFDYADASVSRSDRTTTTVAPQALFMMNSDLVLKACGQLAERLLQEAPTDTSRVDRLYEIAFGRLPSAAESSRAARFLRAVSTEQAVGGESSVSSESWAVLCQAILSANEFVFIR